MGAYNSDILFLHIPKTAGWTVKSYMRDVLPDVLMPLDMEGNRIDDGESGLPIGHVRLADIERFTGRAPESFDVIFAVLRSPYEQQLSQWMFWRDRYARGGRHLHDHVAAKYDRLDGFLRDPRCDFHVWYEQHYGRPNRPSSPHRCDYRQFGGCYRYWIEVGGSVPPNVELLFLPDLSETLPRLLEPYAEVDIMPDVPHTNRSSYRGEVLTYYNEFESLLRVEAKFKWAFDNFYERVSEKLKAEAAG